MGPEATASPWPGQAARQDDDVVPVDATTELGPLARLVEENRRIEAALDMEIDRLVIANVGWPVIARTLGVSRQAARQRHERRVRAAIAAALGSLGSTTECDADGLVNHPSDRDA
jgi:hypothetical protein